MNISRNIIAIKEKLPAGVALCAVSKTKPISDLQEAYDAGQRIFGENKIQEMGDKHEAMAKDIEWHMIGHVQTNKVKYMAPYVNLIHSADRIKLFKEINKQAKDCDRTIDVLLQVKIAEEDSKFGMELKEASTFLAEKKISDFQHVNLVGLMGMATFTHDDAQVEKEFKILEDLYMEFKESNDLKILSTGMSGDYEIAINHHSNLVRIGSSIFGSRS